MHAYYIHRYKDANRLWPNYSVASLYRINTDECFLREIFYLPSSVASFSGFALYARERESAQDAVTRRKTCRARNGHGRLRCCRRVCSFVCRTRDWYMGRPSTLVLLKLLRWSPGSAGRPRTSWSSAAVPVQRSPLLVSTGVSAPFIHTVHTAVQHSLLYELLIIIIRESRKKYLIIVSTNNLYITSFCSGATKLRIAVNGQRADINSDWASTL